VLNRGGWMRDVIDDRDEAIELVLLDVRYDHGEL
jgi:hypothetical protein